MRNIGAMMVGWVTVVVVCWGFLGSLQDEMRYIKEHRKISSRKVRKVIHKGRKVAVREFIGMI